MAANQQQLELISKPKWSGGTELVPLTRIDAPCPEGTRLWLALTPNEQTRTHWDPQTRHWWLHPAKD